MHQVYTLEFSGRKSEKTIQKECERIANREGDYRGQLSGGIRFSDRVLKNRANAERWINEHDSGWYDNLAVKFKDGTRTMWLVKIEFHC